MRCIVLATMLLAGSLLGIVATTQSIDAQSSPSTVPSPDAAADMQKKDTATGCDDRCRVLYVANRFETARGDGTFPEVRACFDGWASYDRNVLSTTPNKNVDQPTDTCAKASSEILQGFDLKVTNAQSASQLPDATYQTSQANMLQATADQDSAGLLGAILGMLVSSSGNDDGRKPFDETWFADYSAKTRSFAVAATQRTQFIALLAMQKTLHFPSSNP